MAEQLEGVEEELTGLMMLAERARALGALGALLVIEGCDPGHSAQPGLLRKAPKRHWEELEAGWELVEVRMEERAEAQGE